MEKEQLESRGDPVETEAGLSQLTHPAARAFQPVQFHHYAAVSRTLKTDAERVVSRLEDMPCTARRRSPKINRITLALPTNPLRLRF